jgi:DNA-binding MarR family transcriptional regulator
MDDLTHLIIEFFEKLSSWEQSVVRGQGVTLQQMHTLEILGIHDALRMKDLAERMGVTTGTLTVMIDRLEQAGLVSRVPNEQDRRSIFIELTEQGRSHFKEHDGLHRKLTRQITATLNGEQRQTLAECFKAMNKEF